MQSTRFSGLFVVIFGSAALAICTDVVPNDIDVIYGGVQNGPDVCEEVERIVREWAAKWNIATTKLDMHYHGNDNDPTVPRPFDSDAPTVVIHGFCDVRYRSYYGFASALRAFGDDSDRLVGALMLGQTPESNAGVWEISLRAARGIGDNWQEDYCDGVEAIRSALRHVAPGVWETAVKALQWLSFVDALVRRGADLEGIDFAARRSSGGGARVFVGQNGVSVQYQRTVDEKFTIEEAIERFVAPKVLLFNTSIITAPGVYELSTPISADDARELVSIGYTSTIGHDAAARALSTILGCDVPVNRIPGKQKVGQKALVLKIRGRLPEGQILDDVALREIGYDLHVLTRTA